MSHGPNPPPPATDFFNFGAMGVDSLDPAAADLSTAPLGADVDELLPLFNNPALPGFDDSHMNIDDVGSSSLPPTLSSLASSREPHPLPASAPAPPEPGQAFKPGDKASANNRPGAGPSPAGTAAQGGGSGNSGSGNSGSGNANNSIGSSSSTLTEFTKRRNWSAKVVEELKDLLQIVDANGRIKYASPNLAALTGYEFSEVQDRFLRDFIHPDDSTVFTAELNEAAATGHPLRLFYRLCKKDKSWAIFEAVGHAHVAPAKFAPNPNNRTPFCQAVFIMARPYPTKNAALLDSFLEHKIENERLKRRIAELRREEADDADESQRAWRPARDTRSDVTSSEGTAPSRPPSGVVASAAASAVAAAAAAATAAGTASTAAPVDPSMPPPDRPSSSSTAALNNTALTKENLEGIATSRPDSIREKMARYEGTTHADTIEMLTGLNYKEGERSRGITTGNKSPALIKGDVGIAIPVDRDPRTGEKKKKLKVAEEYVCTDCGTLDSPEWRKGPSGPKTLCNACGLRWAKKEKKKGGGGTTGPSSASGAGAGAEAGPSGDRPS